MKQFRAFFKRLKTDRQFQHDVEAIAFGISAGAGLESDSVALSAISFQGNMAKRMRNAVIGINFMVGLQVARGRYKGRFPRSRADAAEPCLREPAVVLGLHKSNTCTPRDNSQ